MTRSRSRKVRRAGHAVLAISNQGIPLLYSGRLCMTVLNLIMNAVSYCFFGSPSGPIRLSEACRVLGPSPIRV